MSCITLNAHFSLPSIPAVRTDPPVPDETASYELTLSTANAPDVPLLTLSDTTALNLPHTFSIDHEALGLSIGEQYRVMLRYKVNMNEEENKGDRMMGVLTFTLAENTELEMPLRVGHGPCMGRTSMCFSF